MKEATDITIVLDRSSSMLSVKDQMEEVLNGYITAQQREPGECTFTLVKFDDKYEKSFDAVQLSEVGKIKLEPRGSTALLDAIGRAITETGNRLASMSEHQRPNKVLFVVVTDGEENSSSDYINRDERKGPAAQIINDMVSHQRDKYSWGFLFFGADQDAITASSGLGIGSNMSTNYTNTSRGVKSMGNRLNKMSSAYRAANTAQEAQVHTCSLAAVNNNTVTDQDETEWDQTMEQLKTGQPTK